MDTLLRYRSVAEDPRGLLRRPYVRLGLLVTMSVLPVAVWPAFPARWWLFLPVSFLFQGLILYANLRPNCSWFGQVVNAFRAEGKEVWLTIDDGPDPIETPKTLDLLRQFGARATFFVIGSRALANPDLIRKMVDEGHTVANHSATHPYSRFWSLTRKRAGKEIDDGDRAIQAATGTMPPWFRAPVGMANFMVHEALQERNKVLIGWSASGHDTLDSKTDRVMARIVKGLRPGAIVLLHEAHGRSGNERDRHELMRRLLTHLAANNYECVLPVDEQLRAESF